MNKIEIPQNALRLVTNGPISNWNETRDKFCRILHNEYPNLTYQECVNKFTKLVERRYNIDSKITFLNDYKKQIKEAYNRYRNYRDFNDKENMKTCIDFYQGVNKKGYDRIVDELYEMGMTYSYEPDNMDNIPKFLNQEQKQEQTELAITQIVVAAVVVAIFLGLFMYGFNN